MGPFFGQGRGIVFLKDRGLFFLARVGALWAHSFHSLALMLHIPPHLLIHIDDDDDDDLDDDGDDLTYSCPHT